MKTEIASSRKTCDPVCGMVDGVVLEGNGSVDESMMTGESIPVGKTIGGTVLGATLNDRGSLIMRAEKVGADTLLARIVNMVAEAQRSRAPSKSWRIGFPAMNRDRMTPITPHGRRQIPCA